VDSYRLITVNKYPGFGIPKPGYLLTTTATPVPTKQHRKKPLFPTTRASEPELVFIPMQDWHGQDDLWSDPHQFYLLHDEWMRNVSIR
jgi:hypothetical protein